ncbi:MAG: peptidase MA family metallohydrolase [Anaerolineae bacterium]
MSPLKTWLSVSPESGTRLPRSNSRVLRLASILLLLAAFLLGTLPVYASAPITVRSDTYRVTFSQSLTFTLEASAEVPIVDAVLFYGRANDRLVRRIYPSFTPGPAVRIQHVEELEPGQFAPGTELRYWWQLRGEEGDELITTATTFAYLDDTQDWQLLAGERVDLFWYGRAQAVAERVAERAESVISVLEDITGVPMAQRVRVYLYNSQRDMAPALSLRSEGYDDRVMTLGVAVDEVTLLLLGSHRDVEGVVAHELSHIVVGHDTQNPYSDLPRWLDEGLAMYAEGDLSEQHRAILEQAVAADALLSVRSMTSYSGRAEEVDLFYAEAYSIVDYMRTEFGEDHMRDLLSAFGEGMRQEEALQQVYGFGLEALDTLWRASLGLSPRQKVWTPTPAATADLDATLQPDLEPTAAEEAVPERMVTAPPAPTSPTNAGGGRTALPCTGALLATSPLAGGVLLWAARPGKRTR